MLSASEQRLNSLWLKAMAVHDPSERESLLWEFRDALHEYIEQRGATKHQEASAISSYHGLRVANKGRFGR
jgi:hypothetical protein